MDDLRSIQKYFKDWEKSTTNLKKLMSKETRQDLDSLLYTFTSINESRITSTGHGLVPARFNSDVEENIFCQQHGLFHGNRTNPTYIDYMYGTNGIILSQTLLSKKRKANCSNECDMYLSSDILSIKSKKFKQPDMILNANDCVDKNKNSQKENDAPFKEINKSNIQIINNSSFTSNNTIKTSSKSEKLAIYLAINRQFFF